MTECKNCGAAATVELQFHQVSDVWQPYCDGCHEEMKATADEVNQHEMDRFGGAFGLAEWLVRELPKALPDRVSIAYAEAQEWAGAHDKEQP